jgi:hypothetical protein
VHVTLGRFPEWMWNDWLLVDNWTYRCEPKRFLFVSQFDVLPHVRAAWVLDRAGA